MRVSQIVTAVSIEYCSGSILRAALSLGNTCVFSFNIFLYCLMFMYSWCFWNVHDQQCLWNENFQN